MAFIKIGGAALNQTPIDWENNTNNIIAAIEEGRKREVKILCLPELCITGYGCEDLFLSSWLSETALQKLLEIKAYCKGITVSIGLPIRFKKKNYNCSALIKDCRILGFYAKQFLANEGVHYESRWFTPWESGKVDKITIKGCSYPIGELIFTIDTVKTAFEICEDAWVSDTLRPASRYAKKGIDLILNPSASHFAFDKSDFRYKLISNSSKTFDCTYVYANLLGNEAGRMIYDGEVLLYQKGEMIQRNNRLSFKNYNLVSAEIDFSTGTPREEPLVFDERDRETEFWEATTLGLYDYLRKSNSNGFVLSLSGGADSSTCAVLVSEMVKRGIKELGIKNFIEKSGVKALQSLELENLPYEGQVKGVMQKMLITAYQGTENSGAETLNAAQKLAQSIHATFYTWEVDKEINEYLATLEKAIERKLTWAEDDIALQNIQARARSPIIWMLANINKALLITTSNRSEGDVGYATMDGDTAGSIAPIAGVTKDFIRKWLLWAEENLNQTGLRSVNTLTPTAELRPKEKSQTDETDLMPYSILAAIEKLAIQDKKSPVMVFEALKTEKLENEQLLKEHIIKFFHLWAINQWKRERFAPSFHLDAFNIDPRSWFRFPILSGAYRLELKQLEQL